MIKILNSSTLQTCLNHYRLQRTSQSNDGTTGGLNTSIPGCLPSPSNILDLDILLIPVLGLVSCLNCTKYWQLLSDVLQDLLKFQEFSSAMLSSSKNLLNIGIRKAFIFNLLHEAMILKETTWDTPEPVPTSGKTL